MTENKHKYVPVFKGEICNYLLNKGYRLDHVAKNRKASPHTVFYFDSVGDIRNDIAEYIKNSPQKQD